MGVEAIGLKIGSNPGLEATYTEHDFTMSERGLENCCAGNRTEGSKSLPLRQS